MGALTSLFESGGLLYSPIPLPYRIADVLTALLLCYAGISGLRAWRAHRGASDARYWLLAGSGMLYLAADELQSIHERIGKWLWSHGWQAPSPFTHNDDALLFLLAFGGLCITALYFRALLEHRRAARLLLAGMVVTGVAVGLDALAVEIVLEEVMEFAAAFVLAYAFATRLHRREDDAVLEVDLAAVVGTRARGRLASAELAAALAAHILGGHAAVDAAVVREALCGVHDRGDRPAERAHQQRGDRQWPAVAGYHRQHEREHCDAPAERDEAAA